ncbi:MAG TPA: hypothetical protein DEQ40_08425 [Oxalobacteraceae bacterium]|nr:hypothetical protein [Oxalobacteraceae bacterium]
MADPEIWYPSANGRAVKALRFLNLLDDAKNVMSPVKMNLWSANLAAFSTVMAGILGWMAGHWGMLEHVGQVGSLVGPYLGGSHIVHHFDKSERNKQASRMKDRNP